MPEPPVVGHDPRQNKFVKIIGALTEATRDHVQLATANLETGYHAAAPSLGVLKSAHEEALAHFDMRGVRDRWEKDLRRWLSTSLARWIQRTKQVSMKLYPNGIAVEARDARRPRLLSLLLRHHPPRRPGPRERYPTRRMMRSRSASIRGCSASGLSNGHRTNQVRSANPTSTACVALSSAMFMLPDFAATSVRN